MKRFRYPLDRALRFRRLQMERIEARLQDLAYQAAVERLTAQQRREQSIEAGFHLLQRAGLRGSDVQMTRNWLARLDQEQRQAMRQCDRLLDEHRQVFGDLVEARRKVELLETLRKRKLRAHNLTQSRQLETEAAELHMARRGRTPKN
jgi:hypothetical protein